MYSNKLLSGVMWGSPRGTYPMGTDCLLGLGQSDGTESPETGINVLRT